MREPVGYMGLSTEATERAPVSAETRPEFRSWGVGVGGSRPDTDSCLLLTDGHCKARFKHDISSVMLGEQTQRSGTVSWCAQLFVSHTLACGGKC